MPSYHKTRRPLLAIADLQETLAGLDREDRALFDEITALQEKRRLLLIERQALNAGAHAIAEAAGFTATKGIDR